MAVGSKLDINTPLGQAKLRDERRLIDAFHEHCSLYLYAETDKDRDAVNDGIIFNRDSRAIVSVVETKCRGSSIEWFEKHGGTWLITWKKVKRCAFLAREMRVFFTGILYFVPSNIALMAHVYDGNNDKWLIEPNVRETETQATVNGGRTVKENAFLDMKNALRFPVPQGG